MDYKFYIPTSVIAGRNCVINNSKKLSNLGKKALIVTGKQSSRENGSLKDTITALDREGVDYQIFDKVLPNPDTKNVAEAGDIARKMNAELVIGVGGGSPMDAAKAAAVLRVNDIDPDTLFDASFEHTPIPVVAVPTTAGTGSEVTPYSVVTSDRLETKKGFGTPEMFPKVSFLDGKYMKDLPIDITIDTMIDALSHSIEGIYSDRSTIISDDIACMSIKNIFGCINKVPSDTLDLETRDKLLYGSMLAGMVISHTGTTILHGMGYNLTYFDDLPHGRANGVLMHEYMKLCEKHNPVKGRRIVEAMGLENISQAKPIFDSLLARCDVDKTIYDEEMIEDYTQRVIDSGKIKNTLGDITNKDIYDIYKKSLLG